MKRRKFLTLALCGLAACFIPVSCGNGGGGGGTDGNSPNVLDGYVYFAADDGSGDGIELWRSNGIDAPEQVADINSGGGDSYPVWITELGGKIYFTANNPTVGTDLFRYDPVNGASLAAEINTGTGNEDPSDLTVMDGKLYFRGNTEMTGDELFVYDPVLEKANLVADINSGPGDSDPDSLTVLSGRLYFLAEGELLVYDPAAGTTEPVADFNGEYAWGGLTVLDGSLYFAAATTATGYEIFVYDPVLDAVDLAAEINTGPTDSLFIPAYITAMEGRLYFMATTPATGYELFSYDPVLDAASLVADIESGTKSSMPEMMTDLDGKLYINSATFGTGRELFVYDPVLDAVNMVADINSGSGDADPASLDKGWRYQFTVMDDTLYFTADNGSDGFELYTLEPGGVPEQAGDINPGGADFIFNP